MTKRAETLLRGIVTFPVTPLSDSGKFDEKRFRHHLDYLIEGGVHGLVVIGSTGSIGSFDEAERKTIASVAVRHTAGRVPLIVGTGSMNTAEAMRLTQHAQDIGADGVQVVALSHWPLTEEELFDYYADIAAAVSMPVLVHNVPSLTGMDIKPALMARLSEIPNIRYAKDGSGDPSRVTSIQLLSNGRAKVVYDHELTGLQGLLVGAEAWGALFANVIPRQCVELYRLAVEKPNIPKARDLYQQMFPLLDFLARKSAVRVVHGAFEILGWSAGKPRRPLQPLNSEDMAALKSLLTTFGLLREPTQSRVNSKLRSRR